MQRIPNTSSRNSSGVQYHAPSPVNMSRHCFLSSSDDEEAKPRGRGATNRPSVPRDQHVRKRQRTGRSPSGRSRSRKPSANQVYYSEIQEDLSPKRKQRRQATPDGRTPEQRKKDATEKRRNTLAEKKKAAAEEAEKLKRERRNEEIIIRQELMQRQHEQQERRRARAAAEARNPTGVNDISPVDYSATQHGHGDAVPGVEEAGNPLSKAEAELAKLAKQREESKIARDAKIAKDKAARAAEEKAKRDKLEADRIAAEKKEAEEAVSRATTEAKAVALREKLKCGQRYDMPSILKDTPISATPAKSNIGNLLELIHGEASTSAIQSRNSNHERPKSAIQSRRHLASFLNSNIMPSLQTNDSDPPRTMPSTSHESSQSTREPPTGSSLDQEGDVSMGESGAIDTQTTGLSHATIFPSESVSQGLDLDDRRKMRGNGAKGAVRPKKPCRLLTQDSPVNEQQEQVVPQGSPSTIENTLTLRENNLLLNNELVDAQVEKKIAAGRVSTVSPPCTDCLEGQQRHGSVVKDDLFCSPAKPKTAQRSKLAAYRRASQPKNSASAFSANRIHESDNDEADVPSSEDDEDDDDAGLNLDDFSLDGDESDCGDDSDSGEREEVNLYVVERSDDRQNIVRQPVATYATREQAEKMAARLFSTICAASDPGDPMTVPGNESQYYWGSYKRPDGTVIYVSVRKVPKWKSDIPHGVRKAVENARFPSQIFLIQQTREQWDHVALTQDGCAERIGNPKTEISTVQVYYELRLANKAAHSHYLSMTNPSKDIEGALDRYLDELKPHVDEQLEEANKMNVVASNINEEVLLKFDDADDDGQFNLDSKMRNCVEVIRQAVAGPLN